MAKTNGESMSKEKPNLNLDVFYLKNGTVIMEHLSNVRTGERDHEGRLKDNIVSNGWYLFKGELGNMKAVRSLTEHEVKEMVEE